MSRWQSMSSEQRVAAIKPMWAEGLSSGIIAKRLGASRNAIIGYVNRHLKGVRQPGDQPRLTNPVGPTRKQPGPPKGTKKGRFILGGAGKKKPPIKISPSLVNPKAPKGGVLLMDIGADQCHFPIWMEVPRHQMPKEGYIMCGAKVHRDNVWCDFHRKVVFGI